MKRIVTATLMGAMLVMGSAGVAQAKKPVVSEPTVVTTTTTTTVVTERCRSVVIDGVLVEGDCGPEPVE